MNLNLITAPPLEPVTVEDMEGQVRLPGQLASEQSFVEGLISAIREQAEAITKRAFITQTWELVLDQFPSGRDAIILPKPPLQSVTSIKYLDSSNVEQTLNPLAYRVIVDTSNSSYIVPMYGLTWPTALTDVASVKVRFVCGYGPIIPDPPVSGTVYPNNVPAGIVQWIKLNVSNAFENRESVVIGTGRDVLIDMTATLADGLIANYRLMRV